jgi:hypothetical protein
LIIKKTGNIQKEIRQQTQKSQNIDWKKREKEIE